MRSAKWFTGATLNFAGNLLADADNSVAVIFCDERGRRVELSRAELASRVAACAAGMRSAGIVPGDRVAAMLPNCPEAVIVLLAAASVGAVFSSCSPDFGEHAVLERFSQIEPRLIFVCDGYSYAGKKIDCHSKLQSLMQKLESVEQMVIVTFLHVDSDISKLPGSLFDSFCVDGASPQYESLSFDHPLYILYSSGTTGKPKCIVHGAGGTLLQHKKELMLHSDLHAGDRIFFFTTCGWMMWNWLVSALSVKATVVLYDGSPLYPAADALLHMAAEERVQVFGTSPRYLSALEKSSEHETRYELPELRTLMSTGAPLSADSYDFVAGLLGSEVQLASISGGTDLISCFALGNPLLPVYAGELQSRGLGMAVDVFNPEGVPVRGEFGELVCTQAFPSMPIGFWGDADGAAYSAAYFEQFPGVWTHGDQAMLTDHNGVVIRGRSDAVLNPAGVRIGAGEVCGPAMQLDEVLEAIAVAYRPDNEELIVLFVVLRSDIELDAQLRDRIAGAIRSAASPRHVPAYILDVPDIPRTLSGKPVELAVRAVVHNQTVDNIDALANPEALEYFRNRPELQRSEGPEGG
jgi:acetoacetyl-CoA synthetase